MLESMLGVARAVIVSCGITSVVPERREEIVVAVEKLHAEHSVSYEETASQFGLCSRTLRRWRTEHSKGNSLEPKSRAPNNPHGKLPETLSREIEAFVSRHPSEPLAELYRRFVTQHGDLCADHDHPKLSYGAFCRNCGRSSNRRDPTRYEPRRGRDAPQNIPPGILAIMDTSDVSCFGFDFKLIPFMEAHSREVFAHQLCDRERAEKIAEVLDKGMEASGGVLALRTDRGTPYLAELTVAAADEQGTETRVARAYQPTDKAILERWFRTAKDALRDVFACIDLREGPGKRSWKKSIALKVASAVIAFYMRFCYPYIPQPHIDGRTPRQRSEDEVPHSPDVVRQILDDQVAHHEHAKSEARRLHHDYGFRWSMKRWLRSVRGCYAEDLLEAARRFDRILLRGCPTCDPRRNPRYLLAIIRTVAEERKPLRLRDRRQRIWNEKENAARQAVLEADRRLQHNPDEVVLTSIELARVALDNHGFGLKIATQRLDRALQNIALRGSDAYKLATDRLLDLAGRDDVCRWLLERIELFRPPHRPFRDDLQV
jgi:transposase-like protein